MAVRGGLTRCARPAGSVAGSAVQRAAPVVEPRRGCSYPSHRGICKKMPEHQFRHFLEFVAVRGGLTRCARPAGSVAGSAVQRAAPVVEPRRGCSYPSHRGICKKMPEHQFRHFLEFVAVRGGFEPPIRCRIHTFQACSFSHSDTSPHFPLTLLGQRGATIGSRPKRVKHYFSLFFYPLKLCSNRFIPAHYGQIVIKKKSCSHKNVTKASQT